MRIRLLGAVAALIGGAAVASAQTAPPVPAVPPMPVPAAPMNPPGLTPAPAVLPPASLPAPPAAPPIMAANPNCGTPAAAACNDCKGAKKAGGGLLGKFLVGPGTASPVGCGCFAAEKTFMWGGCRQFFTPGKSCCGGGIEYGPGGQYNQDNCRHVTSFLNR